MSITIDDLRAEFDGLASCCLHDRMWPPGDVAAVLCKVWSGDESGGWQVIEGAKPSADSQSYTVVRLAGSEGRYGLLAESEDYTGHGCCCDSSTSVYGSLDELLSLGIPEDEARAAIQAAYDAANPF